jgi:hypothetical protein
MDPANGFHERTEHALPFAPEEKRKADSARKTDAEDRAQYDGGVYGDGATAVAASIHFVEIMFLGQTELTSWTCGKEGDDEALQ